MGDCTVGGCMAMVTVTVTNTAILMEDMAGMARDQPTLARTTLLTPLSRTEELQRLIPRLMLKQDLALEAMGSGALEGLGLGASEVMVSEVWALDMEGMEDCTEEVYMAEVFMVAMDSGRSIINTD